MSLTSLGDINAGQHENDTKRRSFLMRVNTPVTQNERHIKDDTEIISTTNLKGIINTANDDFVEISGFAWSELENKNHNIIRHPDMPPEAFHMVWENMKQGKPWMGVVKNRCKNGDHYWVDAFVTPQVENGKVIGYQSVRVKPDRQWVDRAGDLYAKVMSGKSSDDIRRSTLADVKITRFPISFTQKIILTVICVLALTLGALAVLGKLSFLAAIAGLLGGGMFSAVMLNHFLKDLRNLAEECKEIFEDPLAQYIYTGRTDELGAIKYTLIFRNASLRTAIGMVKSSSDVIEKSASEISEGNLDLSRRTEQQASSLEETASSMEEMTSTVQQNADGVQHAHKIVSETRDLAEESKKVASSTVMAMNDINESSSKIVDIIQVIDEIAFQTNLLALNAAVEAARAGDQGRGFAVVAGEVRSLAGRSAEAAKEITGLIKGSAAKVEQGSELVNESGQTMENIVDSVVKVSNIISEIASASQEQTGGIEQVNLAITHIDEATQQNAALVEEVASASGDMTEKVKTLNRFINVFRR
jgi:aerotaxis receptor